MYLPAYGIWHIQPMDQDVINICKYRYRRRYLDAVIVVIENEQDIQNDIRGLCTPRNIRKYAIEFATFKFDNSWKDLKISALTPHWCWNYYDFEYFETTDLYVVYNDKENIFCDIFFYLLTILYWWDFCCFGFFLFFLLLFF